MKILSKTAEGLKRVYEVLIYNEELLAGIEERLKEIAKTVRLDGFRPGKVPVDTVRRMYGVSIRPEIVKKVIADTVKKVLKEDKLLTSLDYATEVISDNDEGITFSLKFEVLPEIDLIDFSGIEIDKYVADVTDKEIQEFFDQIKSMQKKWIEKTGKNVFAVSGDRVIVDFTSKNIANGKNSETIKDVPVLIGDTSLVDDFWIHLEGAKNGEQRDFVINYPKDFNNKKIAGKSLQTSVKVKSILVASEYELDDDFAKALGHESFEKTKQWAYDCINARHTKITFDVLKRHLLDKLSDLYSFDVPQNMLDVEFSEVLNNIKAESERIGKALDDHAIEECKKIAAQRVRLGFIIAEYSKKNKIYVNDQELYKAIKEISSSYVGKEREVFDFYVKNGSAANTIRGTLLEEKVMKNLFDTVKLNEKKVSLEELKEMDEEVYDFFIDDVSSTSKVKSIDKKASGGSEKKRSVKKAEAVSGEDSTNSTEQTVLTDAVEKETSSCKSKKASKCASKSKSIDESKSVKKTK